MQKRIMDEHHGDNLDNCLVGNGYIIRMGKKYGEMILSLEVSSNKHQKQID